MIVLNIIFALLLLFAIIFNFSLINELKELQSDTRRLYKELMNDYFNNIDDGK